MEATLGTARTGTTLRPRSSCASAKARLRPQKSARTVTRPHANLKPSRSVLDLLELFLCSAIPGRQGSPSTPHPGDPRIPQSARSQATPASTRESPRRHPADVQGPGLLPSRPCRRPSVRERSPRARQRLRQSAGPSTGGRGREASPRRHEEAGPVSPEPRCPNIRRKSHLTTATRPGTTSASPSPSQEATWKDGSLNRLPASSQLEWAMGIAPTTRILRPTPPVLHWFPTRNSA